jgi:hypothetical protein
MKVKIQNFCFALTSLGIISSLGGLVLITHVEKDITNFYQIGMIMGFGIGIALTGFILRLISNKF